MAEFLISRTLSYPTLSRSQSVVSTKAYLASYGLLPLELAPPLYVPPVCFILLLNHIGHLRGAHSPKRYPGDGYSVCVPFAAHL